VRNYLEGHGNPFNLVGPPTWFLRELYAFDSQLVIFPSAEDAVYRVARYCLDEGVQPLMNPAGERDHGQFRPDQRVYVHNKLIPITTILPFVQWSPVILRDLAERCFERVGGLNEALDRLDDYDEAEEKRLRQETWDGADDLAHASWWGHQFKTGGAIDLGRQNPAGVKTPDARHAQPAYRPLNFAGGSATFVGAPARTMRSAADAMRKAYQDTDIHLPATA
jgi:hypothetical protein